MKGIKGMKLLVTGFDPFGGEKINPAFEAIKRLPAVIDGCQIIQLEIPTVFKKSIQAVDDCIAEQQPDAVISVGQAGGRDKLSVEWVGINLDEARIPDNEGNSPSGQPIYQDGPAAYFSTLPNKAILKALIDAKIPATLSYTAGTYVCNHVLYGLMYLIDKKYNNQLRGGFIHVPFLPEQVLDKRGMPYMTVEMMTEALMIAIQATLEHKNDIDYQSGTTH